MTLYRSIYEKITELQQREFCALMHNNFGGGSIFMRKN